MLNPFEFEYWLIPVAAEIVNIFLFISKKTLPILSTFTLYKGLLTDTVGKTMFSVPSFGVFATDKVKVFPLSVLT